MKSSHNTNDRQTAKRLLSWLNTTQAEEARTLRGDARVERRPPAFFDLDLGIRIHRLVTFLNWESSRPTGRNHFQETNKWLRHFLCYPQLEWSAQEGLRRRWIAKGHDAPKYGDAVTDVLSLHERGLLRRFRRCAGPGCGMWFFTANMKRKTHSGRCRHALSYSNLSPTKKRERRKYSARKMKERRAALKALERGQLKAVLSSRRKVGGERA